MASDLIKGIKEDPGQHAVSLSEQTHVLVQMAIDKDLDINKLEKIIELKNQEQARAAQQEFERNFSLMQAEFTPVAKSKAGSEGKFKYAPMSELQKAYGPIIAKHGFSYRHREELLPNGGKRVVMRISGWGYVEEVFFDIPRIDGTRMMNAVQIAGAMSTYGRRYTFMSGFGVIVEDEDIDDLPPGAIGSQQKEQQAQKRTQPPADKSPELQKKKRQKTEIETTPEYQALWKIATETCGTTDAPRWTGEEREQIGVVRILKQIVDHQSKDTIDVLTSRIRVYEEYRADPAASAIVLDILKAYPETIDGTIGAIDEIHSKVELPKSQTGSDGKLFAGTEDQPSPEFQQ